MSDRLHELIVVDVYVIIPDNHPVKDINRLLKTKAVLFSRSLYTTEQKIIASNACIFIHLSCLPQERSVLCRKSSNASIDY